MNRQKRVIKVPRLGHDSPQIHKSRKPEESAPKNEETSIRKPNDSAGSAPSNSQKPTDSAPVDKSQKPADSEPDPVRKPTGGDSYWEGDVVKQNKIGNHFA